jgi:zinc-ribbon domain/Domain of unknown function (DUF4878)
MYCVHCGAENSTDATFCHKCGNRLPEAEQDERTIPSTPSAYPSTYGSTPYTDTPYTSSETVYAPPPPSGVPSSAEKASSSGLSPAKQPKRRRVYILVLALLVLLVIAGAGAYVYLNRSTPDKTITTYYSALTHGDFQTAYDQLSTVAQSKITEPQFVQFWQNFGGVKAWSLVSSQEQGSTATAVVTLTLGNGQIRLASIPLIDENGTWKIENVQFE